MPATQSARILQNTETPISVQRAPGRVGRLFNRFPTWDVTALFERKRGAQLPRSVYIGLPLPDQAWKPTKNGAKHLADGADQAKVERHIGKKAAAGWCYPSNQVITSKYNLVTFLPRNLLEQFRRVANIFFLVLVILQFFPRFENVSPALAALPLLVVLGITALKDGYEDLKRHQSDRETNTAPVRVLSADNFHNPNMTEGKNSAFSLRTIGLGFIVDGRASKRERSDNAALEEAWDDAEAKKRNKRFWWGARKRKVQGLSGASEQPKSAPGGGAVTDEKLGSEKARNRPAIRPIATEYDDTQANLNGDQVYGGKDGRPRWKIGNWEDLKVGDFVKLKNNEAVPADIVICSTSEEEDVAYVETKNLDGETNLKSRSAVTELNHIRNAQSCTEAKFVAETDAPNVDMLRYSAAVTFHDGRLNKEGTGPLRAPINLNQALLRGTVLRNTEWVIGLVMATGFDTKIVLNSGGTPSKRSKIERQMNPQVLLNLLILAIMCVMCAIGDHILEVRYFRENAPWMAYATLKDDNPNINGLISFANAMITFQNIVPISLYISIEFVKLVQAFFIWADDDILYSVTGRRTSARSWNLSDDLGQIEYSFSDKTGTLTKNVRGFRHCTVGGKVYKGDGKLPQNVIGHDESSTNSSSDPDTLRSEGKTSDATVGPKVRLPDEVATSFHDDELVNDLKDVDSPQARLLFGFFVNLALCHTVLAETDEDGTIQYKAQSPDEAALVQAAADAGFVFLGRDKNFLKITTPGEPEPAEYELLNIIEFSSARKRMSVIVRRVDDDRVFLLMKGADNVIFERLAPGQEKQKIETNARLDEFASEGLRTLTLSYREMDIQAYHNWDVEYHDASVAVENRENKMEAVADKLEREATLLGATAIEDKLQDGVPETLIDLKRAGIKVWVCTGDKLETAVAIGMSSNLLAHDMNLIIVRGGAIAERKSAYSQLRSALIDFFRGQSVVDKVEAIHTAQGNGPPMKEERPDAMPRPSTFSGVGDLVDDDNGFKPGGYGLVIDGASLRYCFDEPLTKELLLELSTRCNVVICCRTSPLQKALVVKLVRQGLGAMCLAIGDGANDVSMIQAADVGIGVAGEEGLQAVNSSDYSIGQFRYLSRLLLVHGTWDYMRNSNMIVNFFYKEIIGIGILFFFQFYCALSTTTVYEYTYILFWNVFWTLTPVLAIGVMDRNIDQHVLQMVPELYRDGREGRLFGLVRFSWYMLDGTYQAAVIFFFVYYAYNTTTTRQDGWDPALYEFSTLMAVVAVWCANFYNGLNTHAWTWWVFGSVLLGPFLITIYTVIYSAIKPGWIWTLVYGNNIYLFRAPVFWFLFVFTFILSLMPRYLVRYVKELYLPSDIDIMKITGKYDKDHDYYNNPMIPGGKTQVGRQSLEQTQSNQQAPLIRRQQTDMSATGSALRQVNSRGFNFDQADGMGGQVLRSYTSHSLHSQDRSLGPPKTRPRSGSVRKVVAALGFPTKKTSKDVLRTPSTSRFLGMGSRKSKLANEVTSPDSPNAPDSPRSTRSGSQPPTPTIRARGLSSAALDPNNDRTTRERAQSSVSQRAFHSSQTPDDVQQEETLRQTEEHQRQQGRDPFE